MTATDPREVLAALRATTAPDDEVGWSGIRALAAALDDLDDVRALVQVPSGRVLPADACPCCGSPVRVHTADEGTCSYEPAVTAATIETVREALDLVLRWPLPQGTVENWALPRRLAVEARAALAALPPKADG